jgi:signal transduction histidine kinase
VDFNVDPRPPVVEFTVAPPIWKQPWFLGLMGLLLAAVVVGIRSYNVQRWNRALQEVNADLEHRVAIRTAELEESNRELEAFAHSVSHDLRTPVRAMEGFAVALEQDYGSQLDAQGRGFVRHIADAARRMETLIHDLLNYSRLGRVKLQLESIALNGIVRSAVAELSSEIASKNADITIAEELYSVRGHRATLTQIVINLLSNAIKFVAPGVRPAVKVWTDRAAAGRVRLWVQDSGIGVDPRQQSRIFSIFERLHGVERYPGTGVGLAIVSRACERLGGKCGVESLPGAGSRFWVELPAGEIPRGDLAATGRINSDELTALKDVPDASRQELETLS